MLNPIVWMIVSAVLVAVLVGICCYLGVRKLLGIDKKIDERQIVYSKLASMFEKAGLPKLATAGHYMAAIAGAKLLAHIRQTVDSIDGDSSILRLFKEHFDWALPLRLKDEVERAEIAAAIVKNADARKAVIEALAEHDTKLIEDAAMSKARQGAREQVAADAAERLAAAGK